MFKRIKRFLMRRKDLRKLDNVLEVRRLDDRINALQNKFVADDSGLQDYIEGELQRLVDDLDFDSIISRDNFGELVAEIVRDELGDAAITIDLR